MLYDCSIIDNIFCFDDMCYEVKNNRCVLRPDLNTPMSSEQKIKRDKILERLKQELRNSKSYQVWPQSLHFHVLFILRENNPSPIMDTALSPVPILRIFVELHVGQWGVYFIECSFISMVFFKSFIRLI